MTLEEAIADIRDNIKPIVGGKSLDMAIQSLTAISELSKRLKAVNRYDMDEKVLIGFNMAVAIFNECFGESCALKNEQSEQNVGMCQQNVGEMSEKTDGDLIIISRQAVEDAIAETIVNGESLGYGIANEILSDLPPVKPLKNEQTDGDLISRQAALDRWDKMSVRGRTEFDQAIMMLPSTEKTAEWIEETEYSYRNNKYYKCSNCGRNVMTDNDVVKDFPYCHCGCRMKGETDGENQIQSEQ